MEILSYIGISFILGLSGAMMPGPVLAVTITETLKRGFMAAVFIVLGHSFLELITVVLLALGVGVLLNNNIIAGIIGVVGGGILLWMTIGMLKEVHANALSLSAVAFLAFSLHVLLAKINSYQSLKKIFLTPASSWLAILGILGTIAGAVILWHMVGKTAKSNGEKISSLANTKSDRKLGPFGLGFVVSLSNPYWTLWWLTVGLKLVTDSLKMGIPIVSAVYFGHILSDFAWYCLVGIAVVLGREIMSTTAYRWLLAVCGAFLLRFGPYFIYTGAKLLLA